MQKKKENKNYGLLSLIGMTISIVIGSGIFIKNQEIINSTGSVFNSMMVWIIGGLIVFSIFVVFIEIISITEITGEQSTLTNWGRHLIGVRFGSVVGYYMTFVYLPIMVLTLFSFGAEKLISTTEVIFPETKNFLSSNNRTWIMLIATSLFILFFALINSYTIKPGKIIQNVGGFLKVLPLLFLTILFLVMIILNPEKINLNQEINMENTINKGLPPIALILMTTPATLFAFDGFLLSGPLSKEGKNENTFKLSFIFSLIFLIITYILFSISIFGLGEASSTEGGAYGTIDNSIFNAFSNNIIAAKIIDAIVTGIIFISILTSGSGFLISGARMLTDLSAHNGVLDSKGKYIKRNRFGVSVAAGNAVLLQTIAWFIIISLLNLIVFNFTGENLIITSFASELGALGAFTTKMFIVYGGVKNRFTKKVEVKKQKLFMPIAILAILLTSLVVSWFAFTTIAPYNWIVMGEQVSDNYWPVYFIKLISFVIIISYMFIVIVYNEKKTKNIPKDIIESKLLSTKKYYGDETIIKLSK